MKTLGRQIVFREIPNEVSLSYLISGCSLRCPGCHSVDAWNGDHGEPLTLEIFRKELDRVQDWVTCVLFMGGEWEPESLLPMLKLARERNFRTALYTGQEQVSARLRSYLDYLKTGPYLQKRGGLDSSVTNQRLIDLKTGQILNHFFCQNKEAQNDQTYRTANS